MAVERRERDGGYEVNTRLSHCFASVVATLGLLGSPNAHAESVSIDNIEGVYTQKLSASTTEKLMILKLSSTTAYFELYAAGGGIVGIADLQSDGLLYQEDSPHQPLDEELEDHTVVRLFTAREHYWCRFGIHFGKTEITFTDPVDPQDEKEDPQSARGTCGNMYGGLVGAVFKLSTRRKLTAIEVARMIRSENFYNAMTWREMFLQGKTPEAQ
jgi:hypothetical protein